MAKLHLVLAFNDDFWAPAYAVMRSVCLTTSRRADLVFHLCQFGVTEAHRQVLDTIEAEFGARVIHHSLDQHDGFNTLRQRLPMARRLHPVIYARLLLPAILPADIERVLYLDCDTMVVAPIEKLIERDMDGHALAAVPDGARLFIMGGRNMRARRDVFDTARNYFNSGVLLIDLPRFAAIDLPGKLEAMIASGTAKTLYYDQDILNLVFADNWLALEWRFNVIDPRPVHEGLDPFIMHYTGERRPWGIRPNVAFARLYRHVMTNEVYYQFLRERLKRRGRKVLGRLLGRK
jgi:lipopolysaccharide biosynthesis glycosyltransferase